MHRCLFSYALPAEIRCLSVRFLTQRQPLKPRWLPAQSQWRSYGSAVEGKEQAEQSWVQSPLASHFLDNENIPETQQYPPGQRAETNEDPYDFILEGYAAEPVVRQTRRELAKQQPVIVRRTPARIPVLGGPSSAVRDKRVQGFDNFRRKVRRRAQSQAQFVSRRRVNTWESLPQLWGRPKFVTLPTAAGTSDRFSHAWNMNYARVHNQTDDAQRGSCIGKDAPLLDTRTARWVEIVIERQELGQAMDLDDLALEFQMRKSAMWSNIALWLLYYDRAPLLGFLHATCSDSDIPASRVADSFHSYLMHLVSLGDAERAERIDRTIDVLHIFAERAGSGNVILTGSSIRQLLKFCNSEQIASVYQAVRTGNFRLHYNTYLHFASALAKNDHFHQGLDALLQARQSGAPTRSPQFRSVCATLLRRSVALPGGMRVCLRIVDNLVKIGVALTTRLCNVLILNAVEAGDINTAYAIYHSLVEHKLKADEYTYALLLKGCKQNLDNADMLNETIQSAIAGTKIMKNPILATEILHCLALHHAYVASLDQSLDSAEQDAINRRAWRTICDAYAQLFDITAIEKLKLPIPVKVKADTTPATTPMPATVHSVALMLQIYCQLMSGSRFALRRIHDIHQQYNILTQSNEAPFNELARTDHCANALLTAFTKNKRTLNYAAAVIKDMQRSVEKDPILGCAPTVRSFSIFLHGFTRHGEMKLAEQVLTYMRSKGIEPNEVTWNTLLSGYAGAQDVEGLLDSTQRAERTGHVWDEWTYKGLRRLRDVRKYRQLVEEKTNAPRLDFTEDLKAGLGARIYEAEHEEVDSLESSDDEAVAPVEQQPADIGALDNVSARQGSPTLETPSDSESDSMDARDEEAVRRNQVEHQRKRNIEEQGDCELINKGATKHTAISKAAEQNNFEPDALAALEAEARPRKRGKRQGKRKSRGDVEEPGDWE